MNILKLPIVGMQPLTTFAEFLTQEMNKRGLSVHAFAQFLGISHQTLGRYLEYTPGSAEYPKIEALVKISKALDTDLGGLVAMIEPSRSRISPSILLLAERIQRLSPEKREMVDALILGLAFKQGDKGQ